MALAVAAALLSGADVADAAGPDGNEADPPYRVEGGAADPGTYNGFRRYHATCSHCHGPDGLGSTFGRSLIARPLPFAAFREAVLAGVTRGDAVMRGFADDPNVEPHIADIYAYLRARADGALGRGRPRRLE